jgi:hypothetical protein
MVDLKLVLTRDGEVLGSWDLSDGDLAMSLEDAHTGENVATFTASGAAVEQTEVDPVTAIQSTDLIGPLDVDRHPGDDFTMPLPDGHLFDLERPPLHESKVQPGYVDVWSRQGGSWRKKGAIRPGQKVRFADGCVRFKREGSLLVEPGPSFTGCVELPGGGVLPVNRLKPMRAPIGSVVLLTGPDGIAYCISS